MAFVLSKPRIGILGGGQLGMMLAEASAVFPADCQAMDASESASASRVIPVTRGDVTNVVDVSRFGATFDIVTIEVEKVSAVGLRNLEAAGVTVYPQAEVVKLIQDKGTQKEWLDAHGFRTSAFQLFGDDDDVRQALSSGQLGYPFVQKLRREGYDGRGVKVVRGMDQLDDLLVGPCVIEALVPIAQEVSVVVARGVKGQVAVYDPVEMVFREGANILDLLVAPARIPSRLAAEAQALASRVAEELQIVGVLAVEMFIDHDGVIWINELAPRPHNSGHHTIEACSTSQYEQHLRAITEHELGPTELKQPAVLVNVLGAAGHSGVPRYVGLDEVEAMDGVYVHLYGKQKTWPMRKMGHVTVVDADLDRAMEKARRAREVLQVHAEADTVATPSETATS